MTEYCYSTDEEYFGHDSLEEIIDYLQDMTSEGESIAGASYWKAEKVALQHKDCIDSEGFLESCDERAYEYIGENYDNCYTDVSTEAKMELKNMLIAWAEKHVKMSYWVCENVQELRVSQEDLDDAS